MKIKCDINKLRDCLAITSHAIGRKSTVQIFESVLIETGGESIRLTANASTHGVTVAMPAIVEKPGAVCLNHAHITKVASAIDCSVVAIGVNGNSRASVIGGVSKYSMLWLKAESFPAIDAGQCDQVLTLRQSALRRMLNAVAFAQSKDHAKYSLNSVLFRRDGSGRLTLAATDGRRIAVNSSQHTPNMAFEFLLPSKAVDHVMSLSGHDGDNDMVDVSVSERKAVFKFTHAAEGDVQTVVFSTDLIAGKFPEYEKILVQYDSPKIVIDRKQLLAAVSRVSLVVSDRDRSIGMKFAGDSLRISTLSKKSAEGEADEALAVDCHGVELFIGVNPRFLCDVLEAVVEDKVEMRLRDESSAIIIEAGELYSLLLPMRIS